MVDQTVNIGVTMDIETCADDARDIADAYTAFADSLDEDDSESTESEEVAIHYESFADTDSFDFIDDLADEFSGVRETNSEYGYIDFDRFFTVFRPVILKGYIPIEVRWFGDFMRVWFREATVEEQS